MLKALGATGAGGTGTVTSVGTGTGLTGGPITTTGTISLANTTVTAGTYGSNANAVQIIVNAQGQITNAVNVAIVIANSSVTGLGNMSYQNANAVTITGGTINNAVVSNVNITSVTATFPNSYLTNSNVIIGNVTIALGTTAINLGNLTLSNVVANGIAHSISTKTANYTTVVTDTTILVNTQPQNVTVTLLTAAAVTGKLFTIKKIDSTANTVTISTTSAQTIDGASTFTINTAYSGVNLQSDGSNWWIIANLNGRNGTAGTF
jgi:hypothetical protein